MQEAEGRFLLSRQLVPVTTHGFEQVEGADHIGLDKLARTMDRAIDMRLGRKVDHRTRLVLSQQLFNQRPIANIATHKNVPCIATQRLERIQIARVGELVEVNHRLIALRQPVQNKIAADKTGCASDQNHFMSFHNSKTTPRRAS